MNKMEEQTTLAVLVIILITVISIATALIINPTKKDTLPTCQTPAGPKNILDLAYSQGTPQCNIQGIQVTESDSHWRISCPQPTWWCDIQKNTCNTECTQI